MRYSLRGGVERAKAKLKGFQIGLTALALPAVVLLTAGAATAAPTYSLFGDAEVVAGGNPGNAIQLRSDASPGFGGIDFPVAAGTTFGDVNSLATDYKFESDDSCGGGAPRFQVNVQDPVLGAKNIFVYIGPPPSYTGCPPSVWTNTTDLLEGVNPIDTSQLTGGAFYDPYATALTKYAGYTVNKIQLVTDSGWFFADGEQTVLIDNTNVDGTIYTYETAENCKKGGWATLTDGQGNTFKNQGDCVSYYSTGGRNPASGV